MERVVPILGQYPDAGSLCTMVLEAVLVLLDPEICLNPMAQAKQRVADETPSPAEVGSLRRWRFRPCRKTRCDWVFCH